MMLINAPNLDRKSGGKPHHSFSFQINPGDGIGAAASLDERFDCALTKWWKFVIQRDNRCVRV
jgi:hypothetical protein